VSDTGTCEESLLVQDIASLARHNMTITHIILHVCNLYSNCVKWQAAINYHPKVKGSSVSGKSRTA
jgi:hypothetical protein